ncbi:MAG: hypothetical protein E7773_00785 [Sphingomonas sp.]|uniref:hypothetical protein n=1 Tax=Sphingomonas sp. TaxID=28214 RepID=UPI0011F60D1B|nr:hypothetical protein [Sphingomonas sp.]THD38322.1 MAG: hypothetical protein E7773_00785 [Sphingomonas sp.]
MNAFRLSDRVIDAVARNQSALARAKQALTAHNREKPAGDDADALFAWRRERRDLEDRIAASEGALAFATAAAERATAEAAARKAKIDHDAADKTAEADVRLVHKVDALVRKLADARDQLAASVARTKAANQVRGDLPHIADAEFRVRSRPGETVEEIATFDDVNVDADGNPVSATIWDGAVGKHVPNPALVGTEKRKHVLRPAMQLPPRMPQRFADALRLVDLAGNAL